MTTVSVGPYDEVAERPCRASGGNDAIRIAERWFGLAAFVASTPILAASAIAVRILSGRPPLIAHRRVGFGGTEFWMLKLRTMWGGPQADAPASTVWRGLVELLPNPPVPTWKGASDARVTSAFASLLRKYSLDELPQLIHVVQGEMSLVGPRPITRAELDAYYDDASAEVLAVRPGMTGLWQVFGRNRLTYAQRRRLDLFFVRNWSVRLYLMILLKTPGRLVAGRDAY